MLPIKRERQITRRDALKICAGILGGGLTLTASPLKASAAEPRNSATGTTANFSLYGISGSAHNGFEYVPYSRLKHTGAVSSSGTNFGAGSVRFRLSIKGPQRTVAEYQGTNASAGHTVWASHTTYDVNNSLDGGYFQGYFYPDVWISNRGFVYTGVYTRVTCSMYGNRIVVPTEETGLTESMLPRTGDSGIDGYVRLDDYMGPVFSSPDECLSYFQTHSERIIDVYDADGISVVDKLTIACGLS